MLIVPLVILFRTTLKYTCNYNEIINNIKANLKSND